MSPQRVADAAPISPYPFVVRQERQQPVSSDNADRGPNDHRSKKGKRQRNAERQPRQEEEPRFNIGPPRTNRGPQNNRGVRQVFRNAGRAYQTDRDGIPNYPPPSFQEAMTTPPVSVCSSTTSLALPPNPLSLVFPTTIQPRTIPEEHLETLDQEQPPGDRSPASENDLDFEGTMFIVEKNTIPVCNTDLPSGAELEKRVKNDWLKRRGVEFPAKYTIGSASKSNDGPIGQLISRGKSTSKLPRLQIDPDPTPTNLSSSPISPSKRRFLSLSPLKTIFPPRSPVHQDRATLSAHPSPSSPYSSPSRSLFFRSSSSLATASFLRLPLLSSSGHGKSLSSAHGKSEPLSRQLFKGKGKELAKSPEDLNAWEVVDEDAYENVDKEGNENAGPPRSLMSAVESLHANHADTASSQILTFFDAPRAKQPVSEKIDPWQYMTGLSRAAQETALKDWKGPSSAFIDRPVNRNRSADVIPNCNIGDATTNPTSSVVSLSPGSIESPLPSGPPLTFVRVRAAPPPPPVIVKHTSQVVHPSPLRGTATSNEVDNDKAAVIYQRALDTPLPVTPPFYSADYGGSVAALNLDDLDEGLDLPLLSDIVPARCTPDCRDIDSISAHVAQPAHQSSSTVPTTPSIARAVPVEEPMTPTRHHYPGRPLPRPPPTTNRAGVVDSTYAAPEDPRYDPDKTIGSLSTCPEGLLIDLEDTTLDTIPESDSSTPTDEGFFQYPLRLPMSQAQASSSSVNLSADSPSSFCINSIQGSSTPLRSTSPDSIAAHLSSQNTAFSELTDLDLLVSRVAEADPNGSDYETLLLVSEVLGTANPIQPGPSSPPTKTSPELNRSGNISLIGHIEVKRRRTTKEGQVKVKLTLLDVGVNKCGICLSQFKGGEMAALTSDCRHSFHEKCLARWHARSRTCPLCRVPLDTDIR